MTACVRLGGIAVLAALIAFGAALGLHFAEALSTARGAVLTLIVSASLAMAFCGTKALFNAHGYRRADLGVFAFAGWFIVLTALGLAESAGLTLVLAGVASQIVDIALLSVTIGLAALFGFQAIGFAPSGGRIWRVIGILYPVASITLALVIAADYADLTKASPLLEGIFHVDFVISALALSASVILHGIALTAGAGKVRTGPAAA
jgi:hypothetical protein